VIGYGLNIHSQTIARRLIPDRRGS
jgi:hypothetical protein